MQAITAETVAALPPPTHENRDTSSRAERLARDFLLEGRASLWSAVREVVRDLGYAADTRTISPGYIFRLGLYNKGGLVGLTSETRGHPCACRLINLLVTGCRDAGYAQMDERVHQHELWHRSAQRPRERQ